MMVSTINLREGLNNNTTNINSRKLAPNLLFLFLLIRPNICFWLIIAAYGKKINVSLGHLVRIQFLDFKVG